MSKGFKSFLSGADPKRVYTDGSKEFEAGLKQSGCPHDVSLSYNPQSNGVAENMIKRVKEGTRKMLIQSGLAPSWWSEASKYFRFVKNVCDIRDGTSAYWKRHGEHFGGKLVPFGAAIRFSPSGPLAELNHTFGPNARLGIFVGFETDSTNRFRGVVM